MPEQQSGATDSQSASRLDIRRLQYFEDTGTNVSFNDGNAGQYQYHSGQQHSLRHILELSPGRELLKPQRPHSAHRRKSRANRQSEQGNGDYDFWDGNQQGTSEGDCLVQQSSARSRGQD